MDIIFNSKEHKKFFFEYLDKCKVNDEYHRAFFYVIGLSDEARRNINRLFDFKEDCIKLEGYMMAGRQVALSKPAFWHLTCGVDILTKMEGATLLLIICLLVAMQNILWKE